MARSTAILVRNLPSLTVVTCAFLSLFLIPEWFLYHRFRSHDERQTIRWIATALRILLTPIVGGAVTQIASDSVSATSIDLRRALRIAVLKAHVLVLANLWGLIRALISVFGILFNLVRFNFTTQAVVVEGAGVRSALRASADAVEGEWWSTLGMLCALAVPFVVYARLFTQVGASWTAWVVWMSTAAFLITWRQVAQTLLYYDRKAWDEDILIVTRPTGAPTA